jgi:hypothetical protein
VDGKVGEMQRCFPRGKLDVSLMVGGGRGLPAICEGVVDLKHSAWLLSWKTSQSNVGCRGLG